MRHQRKISDEIWICSFFVLSFSRLATKPISAHANLMAYFVRPLPIAQLSCLLLLAGWQPNGHEMFAIKIEVNHFRKNFLSFFLSPALMPTHVFIHQHFVLYFVSQHFVRVCASMCFCHFSGSLKWFLWHLFHNSCVACSVLCTVCLCDCVCLYGFTLWAYICVLYCLILCCVVVYTMCGNFECFALNMRCLWWFTPSGQYSVWVVCTTWKSVHHMPIYL